MGWGRMLLLGDLGQQLDIQEARADLERLNRQRSTQVGKDREQDEQIDALAGENLDLKLCLIALVHLLVNKGVLKQGEVQAIVSAIDPVPQPWVGDRQAGRQDLPVVDDAGAEERAADDEAALDAAPGADLSALADAARKPDPPAT